MSTTALSPYSLKNNLELLDRMPDPLFFEQLVGCNLKTSEELDITVSIPTLQLMRHLTFQICCALVDLGIYKDADPAVAHRNHFPMLVGGLEMAERDAKTLAKDEGIAGYCEDAVWEYARAFKVFKSALEALRLAVNAAA